MQCLKTCVPRVDVGAEHGAMTTLKTCGSEFLVRELHHHWSSCLRQIVFPVSKALEVCCLVWAAS